MSYYNKCIALLAGEFLKFYQLCPTRNRSNGGAALGGAAKKISRTTGDSSANNDNSLLMIQKNPN